MTRDEHDNIFRMAHEAGLRIAYTEVAPWLVRYTALVAAPLEEEIKRLRFCIPEGDAAAAMEYLAYCVEKDVAKEQERCIEIVERELERLFDRDAIPICKRIATVIRENK